MLNNNEHFYTNKDDNLYDFPIDTELLFIYIKNYKVFKDAKCINLNAKYKIGYDEDTNTLNISDNPNFAPIFDTNINLKVICGENGVGKTTLLKLLSGKFFSMPKDFFVVMKDRDGYFYANNKELKIITPQAVTVLDNKNQKWAYIRLQDKCYSAQERLRIGESYIKHKDIFDEIFNKQLFDHYRMYFTEDFEDTCSNIKNKVISMLSLDPERYRGGEYAMREYFESSPLSYITMEALLDNLFDKFCFDMKLYNIKTKETDIIKIIKFIVTFFWHKIETENFDELNKQLIGFIKDSYIIVHEKCYPEGFIDLLRKIGDTLLSNTSGGSTKYEYLHRMLFEQYCFKEDENIKFENLSSGEQEKYILLANLIKKVRQIDNCSNIFEDEACSKSHPKWSRNFISEYISLLKKLKEKFGISNNYSNVIIATHSPFILSDVTKEHIEYLCTDSKCNINDTFAGNIGQMFSDTFFMGSTIGKHSEEILQNILDYINTGKCNYQYLENKETCKKIINSIGDEILKVLMLEKLQTMESSNETD